MSTEISKRLHYIDNLRWLTVSLLIVYHAAIAYNTWGEANYIFFEPVKPVAAVVTFISPWFMPVMFLLAGISARFSLRKRGYGAFVRERFFRLGIPFLFGTAVIAPVLSYIADLTHNGYEGGFFTHYGIFFTRFTDITGYDGGFTLGHFWFLGVLMIVSLAACAVIKAAGCLPRSRAVSAAGMLLLYVAAVGACDIRISGKSVITYFCLFCLGYCIIGDAAYIKVLAKFRVLFYAVFLAASAADTYLFIWTEGHEGLNTLCMYISLAAGIPALITAAYSCLDRTGSFSGLCSRLSYVFYIVHFPITVICQYLFYRAGMGSIANLPVTVAAAYPLTFGLCVLIGKTRYLKLLFGMKPGK